MVALLKRRSSAACVPGHAGSFGQTATITSITSTTFKASFTHADVTSAADSGSAAIVTNGGYDTALITGSGHGYSTAIDSNGSVYTVSTCCSGAQLVKFTPNSF